MTFRHWAGPLLATFALGGCDDAKPEPPLPRPVLSKVVAPVDARIYRFTGTVEPRYRVSLGFRVTGRMISRDVDVGDTVRKGEQVAAIDSLALQFAVQSAIAEVSSARAQLSNASGAEQRQRILAGRNVVPQSQLENAQQVQETSSASVRRAEANLAKANEQLTYAKLRSDMDGVVTAVTGQVGQVMQVGQSVVTVARPDIREASVDIPENIAADLKPGTPFDISLELAPSVRAVGRVREIGPQADASTRTRRTLITLPDDSGAFRLGTTVAARLSISETPRIDLPNTALLQQDGKNLVWIFDPKTETVSAHEVKVADGGGSTVQVSSGLETGMRIVLAGVHSLKEGQKVRLAVEAGPL